MKAIELITLSAFGGFLLYLLIAIVISRHKLNKKLKANREKIARIEEESRALQRKREDILDNIEFLRLWKKNANAKELIFYNRLAPIYLNNSNDLSSVRRCLELMNAIKNNCSEELNFKLHKLKSPKPKWIQQ